MGKEGTQKGGPNMTEKFPFQDTTQHRPGVPRMTTHEDDMLMVLLLRVFIMLFRMGVNEVSAWAVPHTFDIIITGIRILF